MFYLQAILLPMLAFKVRACFEFADEVPEEAQHGSLAHLPQFFFSHLHGLLKVDVVGSARRCLLASSLC